MHTGSQWYYSISHPLFPTYRVLILSWFHIRGTTPCYVLVPVWNQLYLTGSEAITFWVKIRSANPEQNPFQVGGNVVSVSPRHWVVGICIHTVGE